MNKSVGKIVMDFYSRNEVAVTDSVPIPTSEAMYLAAFPFIFAAKLLNNFPPSTGRAPIPRAISVLPDVNEKNMSHEVSFLGMCSEQVIFIIDKAGRGKWTYAGNMILTGENGFRMETEIAGGDEDHFHRASIDTCFEWFRKTWEIGGGFMCIFVKEFFSKVAKTGPENLSSTYEIAVETGNDLYVALARAKQSG